VDYLQHGCCSHTVQI